MKLPTRKRQAKEPGTLPKDFLVKVAGLFGKQFKSQVKGSSFLVYGDLYADEVVLCVSLNHPKTLRAASFHISADLPKDAGENPDKVTEKLKGMVDATASWFAQGLEKGGGLESVLEEMGELVPTWQELDWEGATLFVKLNRDNYALEKVANDYLKKAGFEDDLEEEIENLELDSEDDETIH